MKLFSTSKRLFLLFLQHHYNISKQDFPQPKERSKSKIYQKKENFKFTPFFG
jgi:hypothetical protein